MKKHFSLILCGLAISVSSQAAVLSPEEALRRLGTESLPSASTRGSVAQLPVYTAIDADGDAAIYVFDKQGAAGYLVVSADDAVAPLLGYADSGSFTYEVMPEQMKWWLGEYTRQIEYARANGLASYSITRSGDERTPVAPLLKTRWNQGEPYNSLLPYVGGKQSVTGCVATAVAQVMKYWSYPAKGSGSATIVNPSTGLSESLNLADRAFDWDNMLDSYSRGQYTEEEAEAVAYLMKAVGYASGMEYGSSESSAFAYNAGLALINNFGYNPYLQYCDRSVYLASDWEDMIYNELASGRPVLYGGQSTSGGHQFVCDGYSSDGYFHFNWGWGGMSDGYFLLNSLNPDALGTGGGLGGGFNYLQEATVGIQPKNENVEADNLVQYGALKVSDNGLKLDISLVNDEGRAASWVNTGLSDLSMIVGVKISPEEGGGTPQYFEIARGNVKKPVPTIENGELAMSLYGIPGKSSFSVPSSLADGRYKATIVTKNQAGGQWHPVLTLPQYYNYFYFTKSGKKITDLNVLSQATVSIDNIELLSPLYFNCMAKLRITVTNHAEKEMTKAFYPDLYKNGRCQMMGDGIVVTIPPKTTVTEEFVTEFRRLTTAAVPTDKTEYVLQFNDPNEDTLYPESITVMMDPAPTDIDFSISNFVVPDTEYETQVVNGRHVNVYKVEGSEVRFSLTLTNNGSYFCYPIQVAIFNPSTLSSIAETQFSPVTILSKGESVDLTAALDLAWLQPNVPCIAALFCNGNQVDTSWVYFKIVEGAAVGEIISDSDGPVKYYNMQGVEVANPEKGMMLIKKQGNKTQKIIF